MYRLQYVYVFGLVWVFWVYRGLLTILPNERRHYMLSQIFVVLDTSKEFPSPMEPMLIPVFAACHQGSTWALTMSGFGRCFAHDVQHKTCHKCVHQKNLGKIFPTVYHTPVTGSQIRRYDRNEWVILGYACFEVSCCTQWQV